MNEDILMALFWSLYLLFMISLINILIETLRVDEKNGRIRRKTK